MEFVVDGPVTCTVNNAHQDSEKCLFFGLKKEEKSGGGGG